MELIKDRNFVIASECGVVLGKWDILTGNFYGKSGAAVRSKPRCFTFDNIRDATCDDNQGIRRCLTFFMENFMTNPSRSYTAERARGLEEFMSVGLCPSEISHLTDHARLTKDLVAYIKEHSNYGYYESYLADKFTIDRELADKSEWYRQQYIRLYKILPIDFLTVALTRCENEHVNEFLEDIDCYHFTEMLKNYYKYCMEMYGKVKVERNFLSNAAHIFNTYKVWRQENINNLINYYNNVPALNFTYGEYVIRPLLTAEAFHDEAEQQGNCVERFYMRKVADGETHVVQVRKIDNIEQSVVTCEVSNNGTIIQFLKRFNERLSLDDTDLIMLQKAYNSHLQECWGKA